MNDAAIIKNILETLKSNNPGHLFRVTSRREPWTADSYILEVWVFLADKEFCQPCLGEIRHYPNGKTVTDPSVPMNGFCG